MQIKTIYISLAQIMKTKTIYISLMAMWFTFCGQDAAHSAGGAHVMNRNILCDYGY